MSMEVSLSDDRLLAESRNLLSLCLLEDGAVVDKSLLSARCMEGHWDTLKVVSRIKLVAPIQASLLIKEHLMKMSVLELRSCESLRLALMHYSNGCCCGCCCSTAGNFVFQLHLNLYLGCECSWKVLISMGFVVHQAEPELVLALQRVGVGNMSSAVARSFDMEHLKDKKKLI